MEISKIGLGQEIIFSKTSIPTKPWKNQVDAVEEGVVNVEGISIVD